MCVSTTWTLSETRGPLCSSRMSFSQEPYSKICAGVTKMLPRMSVSMPAEQGGTNVSGGQKQRLCIARALLKKPRILILDDSTSAVDTATDSKIRAALAKTIPGTTKLIIAQRISSVMDADRIIVMNDGKVDGFDTHENLLKNNEIYRDVYDSQTNGGGDFDEGGAA